MKGIFVLHSLYVLKKKQHNLHYIPDMEFIISSGTSGSLSIGHCIDDVLGDGPSLSPCFPMVNWNKVTF